METNQSTWSVFFTMEALSLERLIGTAGLKSFS